ncbi:hypothetical protein [Mesorhizobium erdmanii]|uniref:hypothetical protein n=1 Tax=Mesorhizobium erdmanii TaxID=1777866 RepID=UPI000AAC2113|nr:MULTISPECIES: hypothetical protein [Mesorhizobium]
MLLAGNAAGLQASVPSYAGGITLWAAGLVLISAPRTFALWMRLTALVAAVLFVVSVGMILWGAPLLPTSSPLPAAFYPFLVLTFIGWIWTLLRDGRRGAAAVEIRGRKTSVGAAPHCPAGHFSP